MLCFPGMTSLGGFCCIIGRCKYMTSSLFYFIITEMEIIIQRMMTRRNMLQYFKNNVKSKTTARLTQRDIFKTIFRLARPSFFRLRCPWGKGVAGPEAALPGVGGGRV